MLKIETYSRKPLILIESDIFYKNLVEKINSAIKSLEPKKFSFDIGNGIRCEEEFRFIFETKKIIDIANIRDDIKYFCTNKVNQFFYKLKYEINSDVVELTQENIKFTLRVRVMQDKYKYSLAPHKDSSDTILSFILQLNSNNPGTSLYFKDKQINMLKITKGKINKTTLENIIKKEENSSHINIVWGNEQFGYMPCAWTDEHCYKFSENEDNLFYEKFKETLIKPRANEVYAINNVNNGLIKSGILDEYNKNNYHGVRPVGIQHRNVLIMDLIAAPTSADFLNIEVINTNDNEFFILFKSESSKKLIDILIS